MFKPKTNNIKIIFDFYEYKDEYKWRICDLDKILKWKTALYLDEWNIYNSWQKKLWWNIDYKRLYQFFTSFDSVKKIYIYKWTLKDSTKSKKEIWWLLQQWYEVVTKDVKLMKKSIDVVTLKSESDKSITRSFIRQSFLDKLNEREITIVNSFFKRLNNEWIFSIEDKKCNFDVEMWVDILLDLERWNYDNFIIWTWDSDFYNIVEKILKTSNKVSIFSVWWLISSELNNTNVLKYDIRKIKNFICRNKFIDDDCNQYKIKFFNKTKQMSIDI